MPVEIMKISMKPSNFFDRNPAIDVPPSTQELNKSVLLAKQHGQGGVECEVIVNGDVCCASPSSKL